MLELLSGVGSVLGGLGGLFGKKKKDPTPAQNLLSQAQGARQAADQYGFNPLTMLQYGQPGGAMGGGGGGPSPLASIQLLTDGLKGIDDVVSGDAARRRAADQLNLDLAQLKLDQARSGVLVTQTPYAVNQFGPSPLGVRPVTVQQSHGGSRGGRNEHDTESDANRGVTPPVLGHVAQPDPYLDRGPGLWIDGVYYPGPPGESGGEAIEQALGDSVVAEAMQSRYGAKFGAYAFDQYQRDQESAKWKADLIESYKGDPSYSYSPKDKGKTRKEEYPPSYYERFRYNYPAFRP